MPVEGKRKAQDFPPVIHEEESLAKLVFLNQLVDEGDRTDDLHDPSVSRSHVHLQRSDIAKAFGICSNTVRTDFPNPRGPL